MTLTRLKNLSQKEKNSVRYDPNLLNWHYILTKRVIEEEYLDIYVNHLLEFKNYEKINEWVLLICNQKLPEKLILRCIQNSLDFLQCWGLVVTYQKLPLEFLLKIKILLGTIISKWLFVILNYQKMIF